LGGKYVHNSVEFLNSHSRVVIENGVCRFFQGKYEDMFGWTTSAKRDDDLLVDGEPVQVWTWQSRSGYRPKYLLMTNGTTPIYMNVTIFYPDYTIEEELSFNVSWRGSSISSHTMSSCSILRS
jgi:hypothetical protein